MEDSLLDEIKTRMGCWVLSDLRWEVGSTFFISCIRDIPKNSFSLAEWIECVRYLANTKKTFDNEEEARAYLLSRKRKYRDPF